MEYLNGRKLRDYQVDGLNWLVRILSLAFLVIIHSSRMSALVTGLLQLSFRGIKPLPYAATRLQIVNWRKSANCILADEMGLGKTAQSVCFLNHLYNFENDPGPYLVIAPLSTLPHWQREVETWTKLNAVTYHDHGGRVCMLSFLLKCFCVHKFVFTFLSWYTCVAKLTACKSTQIVLVTCCS